MIICCKVVIWVVVLLMQLSSTTEAISWTKLLSMELSSTTNIVQQSNRESTDLISRYHPSYKTIKRCFERNHQNNMRKPLSQDSKAFADKLPTGWLAITTYSGLNCEDQQATAMTGYVTDRCLLLPTLFDQESTSIFSSRIVISGGKRFAFFLFAQTVLILGA
jgi:hypothetical protein